MIDLSDIIAKIEEYAAIPAVVGYEDVFLDYLYEEFNNKNLHATKHRNLLEVSGDNPGSAIICAHIDRHGLVSLGDGEYVYAAQYIREIKYGERNEQTYMELESIANRFHGERVFSYDPKTGKQLGEGRIQTCLPSMLDGDALFHIGR